MKLRQINLILIGTLLAFSRLAFAQPELWGSLGPTVPFHNPLQGDHEPTHQASRIQPTNYTKMVASALPITSSLKSESFNRFKSEMARSVSQPICLVGSDEYSLIWLAKNLDELKRYRAICYVMQAETLSDLKKIQKAAAGVIFQPVSGEQLAKSFGVPAYPALVYKGWVIQ